MILAETPVVLTDGTLRTLVIPSVEAALGDGRTRLMLLRAWTVQSHDGGSAFATPRFVNEARGSATSNFLPVGDGR